MWVGRHLDVDDRDVGACQRDLAAQFPGGPRLANDVEARLGQQPVQSVPEEYLVVCDHDSHGISARIIVRPSGSRTVMTLPPSAPTRSSRVGNATGPAVSFYLDHKAAVAPRGGDPEHAPPRSA